MVGISQVAQLSRSCAYTDQVSLAEEFRRRASFEARRYGGDPWVFVRELLQNSRDAGASRIDLQVERVDGLDCIVCTDDGCGMSFDHAKRYLFTLYASSKFGERDTAGRFGIGFWSVLRFGPDHVAIQSAPNGGPAWQLGFSGDLSRVERGDCNLAVGTRIELNRPSRGSDPVAAVWNAVRRDARHLRRRGRGLGILEVRVNGRRATADIELEPPSMTFSKPGMRGAVALARVPQVDLLAHGLRVRTTATLDELLTRPERRRRRTPASPSGLLPRVVLDSSRLQVLMARGDAKTDRELHRLVAFGRRCVRRLVREQLDRNAGLGPLQRLVMRGREFVGSRWTRRVAALVAAAASLFTVVWLTMRSVTPIESARPVAAAADPRAAAGADRLLAPEAVERYRGPAVSKMGTRADGFTLEYRPASAAPMLSVFRVRSMDDRGLVMDLDATSGKTAYGGAVCWDSCLEIVLDLDRAAHSIRLPVATGHVLDPASVRVEGGSAILWATADGVPMLDINEGSIHRIEYRTGFGSEGPMTSGATWPSLPTVAEDFATRLRPLAPTQAAEAAREWVQRRVVYDTSADTIARHRDAARSGRGFAERCLEVGAGDCDVQNALLAAILHRAGVEVRMAVGFVGAGGRALPGLHAWVEYRAADSLWQVADASRGAVRASGGTEELSGMSIGVDQESSVGARQGSDVDVAMGRLDKVIAFAAFAGLMAVAILIYRRHERATVVGSDAADLAELLAGALATPDAFGEIPALFTRPVVPLVGGSSVNLRRARSLGRRGMLALGSSSGELAGRAAAAGACVVDAARPEGAAVAAVLGAVDLDRWDGVVAGGFDHPLTRHLEREAAVAGEDWVVVLSDAVGEIGVLEGRFTGRSKASLLVAVGSAGEPWRRIVELGERQPAAAVLLLAESVLDHCRVQPHRARRILSRLAAAALTELKGER